MPTRKYPLNFGSPEKVEISWKGYYKDIVIKFNGVTIAEFDSKHQLEFDSKHQLREFVSIPISENQEIEIRIKKEPEILMNSLPLPGSTGDPVFRVRHAYLALYLYGALNLFIGSILIGIARLDEVLLLGNISIILGFVFILLGVLTQRANKFGILIAITLLLGHILTLIIIPTDGDTRIGGGGYGGILLSSIILLFQLIALPHLKRYRYLKYDK